MYGSTGRTVDRMNSMCSDNSRNGGGRQVRTPEFLIVKFPAKFYCGFGQNFLTKDRAFGLQILRNSGVLTCLWEGLDGRRLRRRPSRETKEKPRFLTPAKVLLRMPPDSSKDHEVIFSTISSIADSIRFFPAQLSHFASKVFFMI